MRAATVLLCLLSTQGLLGCGARTLLDEGVDSSVTERVPEEERCDGLDQDFDGAVDEDFRDELGRYVTARHCGACRLGGRQAWSV